MGDNGEVLIDKETFLKMPPEGQNWLLFKTIQFDRKAVSGRIDGVDSEIKKLKRKKKTDTGISAIAGFIGGFAAQLSGIFKS